MTSIFLSCPIDRLPDTLSGHQALEEPWLEGCRFAELPEVLHDLRKLPELSLDGNPMARLPEAIGGVTGLCGCP